MRLAEGIVEGEKAGQVRFVGYQRRPDWGTSLMLALRSSGGGRFADADIVTFACPLLTIPSVAICYLLRRF